ncbi:hypothetical protein I6N96_15425 [Enterococcus sp. BWM-S5]|uniref:Condensation domain-containing protein n=1 Tax=Enterococcus larvae TaxID=2794352 RepID=A0ABS4CNA0_9ENTE|nr:hypothetical protein [Enterococcus larvae]MBP1047678.1 hypothetical protein [Enterococcus larvae]
MLNTNKYDIQDTSAKEKIRTGQSFLYRKNGYESMVIEFRLKEAVCGEALTNSLRQTLKRYFYLTQKMVEIDGDFYLVKNELPVKLRHSDTLIPLGGVEANYQLIDINYYERNLVISYHHGLCDGRGILPFVRTLLYYYFSTKESQMMKLTGIQRSSDLLLEGELSEPGYVELKSAQSDTLPTVHKKGYSLPEARCQTERIKESYRYEVQIDSDSLMSYAKAVHGTPATVIAYFFSKAIQEVKGNTSEESVVCNMVTDLRAGAQLENTHRNCVSSLTIPYAEDRNEREEIQRYRERINAFKVAENMRNELQKIIALSDHLDTFPTFEEKQQVLSFFETLLSDTYILSYIGQINLGEYEKYIEEVHTYSSGTRGLSIEILALSDMFFLDIMQSFPEDRYVALFVKLLAAEGISVKLSDPIKYRVPKDKIRAV